jgi:hypothetical protein
MKEITELTNLYRECARNLWNTYFFNNASLGDEWDICDEFDDICVLLFSALVLNPNEYTEIKKSNSYDKSPQPLACIKVVSSSDEGVQIQINREVDKSGYWDYPVNFVKPSDVDLRFIDFFDYNVLGFRDFKFCHVRIVGSDKFPGLVGRDALLESNDISIFVV